MSAEYMVDLSKPYDPKDFAHLDLATRLLLVKWLAGYMSGLSDMNSNELGV